MTSLYTGEPLTFADADGYDVFHIGATMDAKIRGGYTYLPTEDTPDITIKPALGDYGWHRLGCRIHQEAKIENDAVKYTYIATLYRDGELVLSYDLTDWAVNYFNSTVTALLFTAEIVDGELVYHDIGDHSGGYTNSYALLIVEEFFNSNSSTAYVVLGDMYMTAGQDFVQQVEKAGSPILPDATFQVSDTVNLPAPIHYQFIEEE